MRPGLEINKETNKNKNNMLMKTKYFIFAASALVALASCSSNDFVGDESLLENSGSGAIAFSSSTPAITRAEGAAAATALSNNFVVYGYKTVSSATQAVFDNYQANYVASSAKSTTTNSAGWEYVGYKNLPDGVTTNVGVTAFSALTGSGEANENAIDQSIKYWDFNASKYDFFAYSLGAGSTSTWARASKMTNTGYSLEGNAAQLGACYISNKKNVVPSSTSATEVDLEFRSFNSKIQLGFYETIPGYSVKAVKFYPSADGTSGTTPSLYAASAVVPNGGKYTVTFDANGKAQLALAASDPAPTTISKVDFDGTLAPYAGADYMEDNTSNVYLGRASNVATKTNEVNVLPNPANVNALNVKMDFTLVSRDGTGETIEMTGATAVIPAAYAMWLPNYKYTYLFKISDNTNAKTAAITGLYPITLDAVITDAVDGSQETITTVDDPSITTYAKGTMVTANDEYKTNANIYIVVDDGTTTITPETNGKLYTATIEAGAAQGITEETVKNALVNGTYDATAGTWTVTDALGKKLVVTKTTGLTSISSIDASDAPNGVAIDVKGAKFTPTSAGNYVFEYFASAKNYTQDEANAYNATLTGAITSNDVAYSFNSYGSASTDTPYGNGIVKFVSVDDTYTTVQVMFNNPLDASATGFVGQQFKVKATSLTPGNFYQLYSTADVLQPIYVTVTASTQAEINAFNATLPDAVTTATVKTPAANHYKVIKVVAP